MFRFLLCLLFLLFSYSADAEGDPPIRLVGVETFVASTTPGARVNGYAYYARAEGLDMISMHSEETVSDKLDVMYRRFSSDNGKTWSPSESIVTNRPTDGGTFRLNLHPGFVDPVKDILITFRNQGVLPTDDPLEGMKYWHVFYSLSRDGDRSSFFDGPVVEKGGKYSPEDPLPGVSVGKNSAMIGDNTCYAIRLSTGEILQPVQISPIGPDGHYYNPGGGYTYHDAAVLIGIWREDGKLDWECSERVIADPKRSTRGFIEPTLAEMDDGTVIMVMRGSNHSKPELPSYRWITSSTDGGRTWSPAEPWCNLDGKPFFSPSACSQLVRHSNGKLYWIGNIAKENPDGNLPRHPLVIAPVDEKTRRLDVASQCVIDDRQEGDSEGLQLSNFFAQEDRASGEIRVFVSPLFRTPPKPMPDGSAPPLDWTADTFVYRVAVGNETGLPK